MGDLFSHLFTYFYGGVSHIFFTVYWPTILKTIDSRDAYLEETALPVTGETEKRQRHSPS